MQFQFLQIVEIKFYEKSTLWRPTAVHVVQSRILTKTLFSICIK